jgi:putative cardiolipin synthase
MMTLKRTRIAVVAEITAMIWLLFILTACTTIPIDYPRTVSHVLPTPPQSQLTDMLLPPGSTPEQSYFLPMDRSDDALDWRLALADTAQASIDAQYYIWKGDESGLLLLNRLLSAADRGVRVRLLIDDIEIKDADWPIAAINLHPNMEVRIFNPLQVRGRSKALRTLNIAFQMQRLNNRMHNKLYLVDNIVGITGGRNIGNEYFGINPKRNNRDTDLLAVGAIVEDMSESFDIYWNSEYSILPEALLKNPPKLEDYPPLREDLQRDADEISQITNHFNVSPRDWTQEFNQVRPSLLPAKARIVYDDDIPPVQLAEELGCIAEATERELIIVSPYFIPAQGVLDLFRELTSRGVRVVIMTNSLASNNVTIAHTGYRKYRHRLLDAGIELYEYRADPIDRDESETPPVTAKRITLHNKILVFDRRKTYIGSLNVDPRSIMLNTEIGLLINDRTVTRQVLASLERDLGPDNAWRVTRDVNGRLQWESSKGIVHSQPALGLWQRFLDLIFTPIPIEDQL